MLGLLGSDVVAFAVDDSKRLANIQTAEAIELFVACASNYLSRIVEVSLFKREHSLIDGPGRREAAGRQSSPPSTLPILGLIRCTPAQAKQATDPSIVSCDAVEQVVEGALACEPGGHC